LERTSGWATSTNVNITNRGEVLSPANYFEPSALAPAWTLGPAVQSTVEASYTAYIGGGLVNRDAQQSVSRWMRRSKAKVECHISGHEVWIFFFAKI
jgi:hypothetical protein